MTQEETQKQIIETCDYIKSLLLSKNKGYGNSAIDPVRIFSKSDPIEQLKVRIDDKLSRLIRGNISEGDPFVEVLQDLIGYEILLLGLLMSIAKN